ncbi:MAG: hypothetical protein DLM59_12785 [Pseudonocardiales bacterium]|nr:MAG: hypothetical protein DLM59_12785 [Pseudonocardiales bacterium]
MPTAQFQASPGSAYPPGPQGPPSGYASDAWQGQSETWQGQTGQPPSYGAPYSYQSGPPKKKSKAGWWIGGGALAVVLILVAVFVAVIALKKDNPTTTTTATGSKKNTGATKVLWNAPFTAASVAGHPILAGVWTDDKAVIRGGGDGLHAYDVNNGKELWNVPIPGAGSVCSMAPSTLNGVGALIYGAPGKYDAACDHLLAVDTATGKPLWTADLKPTDGSSTSFGGDSYTSVSMATDVVVIQTSNVMRGYRTSDGEKKWGLVLKPKDPNAFATCHPRNSLAAGDRALIVVGCNGDSGYVTALNAQTGATQWDHDLTPTEGDELFTDPISVRPAVLQSHQAGGNPQLLVLDDSTGKIARTITSVVDGLELNFRSESSRLTGAFRYPLAVRDGKLYASTVDDFGGKESKVVSIDLSTGQPTWTVGGGAKSQLQVVSIQDKDVVAYDRGGFEHTPRFVHFDLATGKRSDGVQFPNDLSESSFGRLLYVQGNRLVLVATRPSASEPPIVVAGKP